MKPSLAVREAVGGLEKMDVGIVLGGSSPVDCRNAVASFVSIVDAAAAAVVDARGVAGAAAAVERVACLPARFRGQSGPRSEGQLREPARCPSAHFGASKTHDLVSPIAGKKVAGRACTAQSGPRLIRVFGGKNARRSHLLRMVGSSSLEGGSGVGVW
jgi:hypothetical protein